MERARDSEPGTWIFRKKYYLYSYISYISIKVWLEMEIGTFLSWLPLSLTIKLVLISGVLYENSDPKMS